MLGSSPSPPLCAAGTPASSLTLTAGSSWTHHHNTECIIVHIDKWVSHTSAVSSLQWIFIFSSSVNNLQLSRLSIVCIDRHIDRCVSQMGLFEGCPVAATSTRHPENLRSLHRRCEATSHRRSRSRHHCNRPNRLCPRYANDLRCTSRNQAELPLRFLHF